MSLDNLVKNLILHSQPRDYLLLQAISQSLADQLPSEPAAGCAEGEISTIRVRAPANKLIVRRFMAEHPLQVLLNFIASEGYHTQDFKVLTTFPRRDVSMSVNYAHRRRRTIDRYFCFLGNESNE